MRHSMTVGTLTLCSSCAPRLRWRPTRAPPSNVKGSSGGTRPEHDLLGDKAVPADAYYGVQTLRALENFQISEAKMTTYPEFIEAYAMVKLSAARANAEAGRAQARSAGRRSRRPARRCAVGKAP